MLARLLGAQQRESEAQSSLFSEGGDAERTEGDYDIDVGPVAHFYYYKSCLDKPNSHNFTISRDEAGSLCQPHASYLP